MKKHLIFVVSILLAAALCFSLASCNESPCTPHPDNDNDGMCDSCNASVTSPDENEGGAGSDDLVLVSDSRVQFAVVNAMGLSKKAEGYVNEFVSTLNSYYIEGGDLKMNYDVPGFDDAVEVIFGSPTYRGEAFIRDEHYLGHTGFLIELIGNKLFVLGGGDQGYRNAIAYLETTLCALQKYGEGRIDELYIPAGTKHEQFTTEYNIDEITVSNTNVSEFVITASGPNNAAKNAAAVLQEAIYVEHGVWIPYVAPAKITDGDNVIYVTDTTGDRARSTEDGFTVFVKNGDLHIECEFENKFSEAMEAFIISKLSTSNVNISNSYTFSRDVRNIYYEDFGAVGDGVTDDFFAIKSCHSYANMHGHTVNAKTGATYYIGKENGTFSIYIQTDTYWNCCSFIFDDGVIDHPSESKAYLSPIFKVTSDGTSYSYTGESMPIASVASGATSLEGWAPSKKSIVVLYDNTKRHYIRYGSNQNNGSDQYELIIVNTDGTIDPDTPVQWDYTTVSKMVVYPIEDTPITISGGKKDLVDNYSALGTFDNLDVIDRTVIYTYFNDAPSAYNYHARNIEITRSNVTIKNIEHVLYDDVKTSAPYAGFIKINNCSDVVVEGMIFQMQKGFSTIGAQGTSVGMGSYEIAANLANRVTWRHCRISNFFEPDGRVTYDGNMGTNYCKNLMFDDVVNHSFDAHCGLYNGTIRNSTSEHLNFIGGGTIIYENVTVYTDGGSAAMHFRSDYGSIWNGKVIVNGLTLRTSKANPTLSLISATYTNHYFGYTCYLPESIEISNVKIVRYGYKMVDGVRSEWDVSENHVALHLYAGLEKYKTVDISDPNANMSYYKNDWKKCNCASVYNGEKDFYDPDGDGRCNNDLNPKDSYSVYCWGFEEAPDTSVNANPYVATKEVYVTNCGNLRVIIPNTPQFEDTKLYIDNVLQ